MQEKNEIEKYNPQILEEKFYQIWEERGYFELDSNKDIANGKRIKGG